MGHPTTTATAAMQGPVPAEPAGVARRSEFLRWVGASLLALIAATVVLVMRIGPVVAVIAPGHGIHTGDLLGVAAAFASLVLVAPMVLEWSRHVPVPLSVHRD